MKYYDPMQYFIDRFDHTERPLAFRAASLDEHTQWQKTARDTLTGLLRLDRMTSVPPNPQKLNSVEESTHVREKWVIDTQPGITMPFYVLKPKGVNENEQLPAVLATHGHGFWAKEGTAGVSTAEEVRQANADYGKQLVEQGCIVFCPDTMGFGERRLPCAQGEQWGNSHSCRELAHMANSLGLTVLGLWLFDLIKLLDFMSGFPSVDPKRMGVVGLSGGGMQALWLAAMEERIRSALVSGYFYGYEDALLILNTNCSCNYVPGLWENADIGDIGALIAPRALCIETGDQDPLNGTKGMDNVWPQVETVRNAYHLLGAEQHLLHEVCSGGHQFYGKKSIEHFLLNL